MPLLVNRVTKDIDGLKQMFIDAHHLFKPPVNIYAEHVAIGRERSLLAGKCFPVSKFLHYYLEDSELRRVNTPIPILKGHKLVTSHWFIYLRDQHEIVDLTSCQFDYDVNYGDSRKADFGLKRFRQKIHKSKAYDRVIPSNEVLAFAEHFRSLDFDIGTSLRYYLNERRRFKRSLRRTET